MSTGLTVSVVIPTYNRAGYIAETLDAVLSQTLLPTEILVVNDGSTDSTLSVLAPYGDRIRVLSIPNSGDLVARNTGLRAAGGTLVAFCDSDDLWEPDFLRQMSQFWAAGLNPLCAYSDFRVLSDSGLSNTTKFADAPAGYWERLGTPPDGTLRCVSHPILLELLSFQPLFPSCMVADRERFLALGGWDDEVSVGSDFATALRVAEHPPIGILHEPLVRIRKHGGNLSGDLQRTNLRDAEVLRHVLETRPSTHTCFAAMERSMVARRLEAFDSAFGRRDFEAARAIAASTSSPRARHKAKVFISRLPGPLRNLLWKLVTGRAA